MARRNMTDPQKWEDPFFQDLSPANKLIWLYIVDRCDFCGFWRPNWPLASFQIGHPVDSDGALKAFGSRISVIEGKWFIQKYAKFQHGERILVPGDQLAKSFDKCLLYHGIDRVSIGYGYRIDSHMDKDMDRNKDKAKDKKGESPREGGFEAWWKAYPRKVGKTVAEKRYQVAVKGGATAEILADGLERSIKVWAFAKTEPQFIPHPATWLSQGRWQDEVKATTTEGRGVLGWNQPTTEAERRERYSETIIP